ncbi:predicted protein [Arabidopsis lyrata subsp. lyrata]|uniref:Predicted protein n=1 Tax=Arabidopsis lyrata subsp. lyrata TaxID=81972 RepID=D7MW27_ARALL|nr:predicted protein [Arabidopsis lyrata subsp. lyrata]
MVSTRSKRAEAAAAFFGSQSAVSPKKKKAKAVHNSLAEESRCRNTIPDSSNSDTTATIGEGTTPVDVSSSQAQSESSSPRSPTSTSGSNIDKTITSSSDSLSRKDVPDSADGETSVAGVLSSSTVGEKVRNHNILINKLQQKTLVIHGFPIAIQLLLFQSIPLLLRYLPSSEDAQTFYDMSLSVLPTLKTYHTNNILLVENDKDLIVSQPVVSTEEDCVSVGDPKVSHLLSLIRGGYRFSKGDWRGGDASLANCGPDYSPPNTCTPAPVPGLLSSNADSEAIAKLTAEVAHLKNTYAELYVKVKADVVVEVKSFLEARTCGSCSRNCGVAASRADSLSAAVVDTLKPVSSSKPLEEEENVALPSEVKTGKPKFFSSDTGRIYGCVENCSKDVTVIPESRLQTGDSSFQTSVREDDVPSNLQLGQKYLKPMKGRNKRGMISSTRCNVTKSPKRQKQGLPGHVDYIPFHPVPQRLIATFKNQLLSYRNSTYDIDGCEVGKTFFSDIYTPQKWIFSTHMDLILRTFWRKRGSYLAAKGIILLDSLFTQLLCSQYSDFVNTTSPSAFLWDPLVASYIEGTDMGHISDATVDIFRMDYAIRVYEEFIGFIISFYSNCSNFFTFHITFIKMDNLVDDAAIEIYRRVAETSFTMLAPLLLVAKKQSKLALSDAVLSSLSLHEFFNNPELANEGSAFRSFFLKCVAAKNPVANYLESLRIVAQHGDVSHAIAMLYSAVPESDYISFARGMFLIVAQFPSEGIATISSLFNRLGTVAQLDAIGTVVFRHLSIFRPFRRRLFSNLLVLDSIPVCVGNVCNLQNRCLNCFMYWFIIRLNFVL